MSILVIYDSIGFLQARGAPLLGEAPLIGRIRYPNLTTQKCGLLFEKLVGYKKL